MLYDPNLDKDSCGFGLLANINDKASHWLVKTSIKSLARMMHRGAINADGKTGDGCGLMFKKPESFFREIAKKYNFELSEEFAVGTVFLSSDSQTALRQQNILSNSLTDCGLKVAAWRDVPINTAVCGEIALRSLPIIRQVFVNNPDKLPHFNPLLFIARRQAEKKIIDRSFYITSLNSNLVVYKALVTPDHLADFYLDLKDKKFTSSQCVFHQRFSTNTAPKWRLAQPFRFLAHNGEINTIEGNRNWAKARESILKTDIFDLNLIRPFVDVYDSDSSSLDNMLEVLVQGGMDIFKAIRLLIPRAWQNDKLMNPRLKAFYEFHSMHMEPWDGPAALVMTDGRYICCALDRNGLRPARWVMTNDNHIILASEVGVYDYDPSTVIAKSKLGPGEIIAVDTKNGKVLFPDDVEKQFIENAIPYETWLKDNSAFLWKEVLGESEVPAIKPNELLSYNKAFNFSFEELEQVLKVLAFDGQETTASMGDDTPLAVFSNQHRSIYDYFRQQFAQVTNPPIDSLRETEVMSLLTVLGSEMNVFEETENHSKRLELLSPVLSSKGFEYLKKDRFKGYHSKTFSLHYDPKNSNLKSAIIELTKACEKAVQDGFDILILSDNGLSKDKLPIDALLATGAVHHHLIKNNLRCSANLIVETATTRDSHHFACLLSFGATAIYPYLAYANIKKMVNNDQKLWDLHSEKYRKGIDKGLLKIMSKMGIASVASYRGAQLFEAFGLSREIIDLCFCDANTRVQGAGFKDLQTQAEKLVKSAFNPIEPIRQGGLFKYIHGTEHHDYNPNVVDKLRKAVQLGSYSTFKEYVDLVNSRKPSYVRDLMRLKKSNNPIDLDKVEVITEITKRFDGAAMSIGALSPEAHELLAEALNTIGGRSNSGEGGEHPDRFGTIKNSKIKQVASGRFGVSAHYLMNAEVIQIKIAQGAKPGEGGQLPGKKVDAYIASLRHSEVGTTLVSPPPHHDIYSIEDLAQLIFDLKQINPNALVSVKLVSQIGVGTIACGVAKCCADLITISGYDGGTGASPLTSIKYAGSSFEMGLTEAHQSLKANGLRSRVRLQTDGGLKTGLDIIKAAIMGAESFGFGTGPMIAMGCKYLRICHLNTCAVGVATQDKKLRDEHFIGQLEMVINYFKFLAQDVREIMANIGIAKMEDLIGRVDLLELFDEDELENEKQKHLSLNALLSQHIFLEPNNNNICTTPFNPTFDKGVLNQKIVSDCQKAIKEKKSIKIEYKIKNTDRSVGASLAGEVAKLYGANQNPKFNLDLHFKGNAGQSFGVFCTNSMNLSLMGDANDYVAKSMSGGRVVVCNDTKIQSPILIGNTCLYGAIGGSLYVAGRAGERFAVRNSGATTVVEGVGNHGCEYMTGGLVIVLGSVGSNFGAGMFGGKAFIYDENKTLSDFINPDVVDLCYPKKEDYLLIKNQLIEHFSLTGSKVSQKILAQFRENKHHFIAVIPKEKNEGYSLLTENSKHLKTA